MRNIYIDAIIIQRKVVRFRYFIIIHGSQILIVT